jgi:hypothetical protein
MFQGGTETVHDIEEQRRGSYNRASDSHAGVLYSTATEIQGVSMTSKKELHIVVSENSVFFYANPPSELLMLLKKFGLNFEEKVVFCG